MRYSIALPILSLILLACIDLSAVNYYVDSESGNDTSEGTSPLLAWASLDRVNQSVFQPGDSVLFKRGSEWKGMLNITYGGASGQPVVYATYGMGDKPVIHGGGEVQAAIFVRNSASFVTVSGFAVTNHDSLDVYDGAEGLRSGIHIGEWLGDMSSIRILDNEVYFIEGCSNHSVVGSPRGTSLDPDYFNHYQNAGIFVHAAFIDTLIIDGNFVHDCTCTGIFPFLFEDVSALLVQHNSVYNVGGDGIVILHATSPLVQLNSVIRAGNNSGAMPRDPEHIGYNGLAVAGIWSSLCSDPVFQYNYCEGTRRIVWDGQPWDFDLETTGNAIYQYNYSRDNEGGFNLGGEPHQIFRYNVSYNDGAKQGNAQYFFNGNPTYYNNTFYRDDQEGYLINGDERQTFLNNIFYSNGSMDYTYAGDSSVFSHNNFFGHNPLAPGEFPNFGNPIFYNPNAIGKILPGVKFTIEDLRNAALGLTITTGSACIDAAQEISNNGGIDYWGNPLYVDGADIGAHEFMMPNSFEMDKQTSQIHQLIYPNPASNDIYLHRVVGGGTAFTVCDVFGRYVLSGHTEGASAQIDISDIPIGSYWITIVKDGKTMDRAFFVKAND